MTSLTGHNGAKPCELPIEQPTTVKLVVDLKVARELDVQRADEVIE